MHMGGRVRKAPGRATASSSYDTVSYVPADGSPSRQQGRPPTYVRARALVVRRISVFRTLCRQRKMCWLRQPETIRSSPGRTPKLQVARFPARRTIRDCTARRAAFSQELIPLRGRLRRVGRWVSPAQVGGEILRNIAPGPRSVLTHLPRQVAESNPFADELDAEQRAVRSLGDDLASGRWAERNRDLVALDAAELGLRLLIA